MPEPIDETSPKNTIERVRARKAQDASEIEKLTEQVALMSPEDIARKILAEKRQNERARKWGGIDAKTGLLRSKQFKEKAQREIKAVERDPHRSITFSLADFDNFKRYNNEGTDVGDAVLGKVGDKIRSVIRVGDVGCRWGGDELAFLMPFLLPHEKPETINPSERLRKTCENVEIQLNGKKYFDKIPMTFGTAEYASGDTFESMFERASLALRIAKLLGKERTVVVGLTPEGTEILRDVTYGKLYTRQIQNGSEFLYNITDKVKYKVGKGERTEDKTHLIRSE